MRIVLRQRGVTLTLNQRARVQERLELVFGRFAERIDHVVVRMSECDDPEFIRCQLDVAVTAALVSLEHSDRDPLLAVEHLAARAARAVGRAIENGAWGVLR